MPAPPPRDTLNTLALAVALCAIGCIEDEPVAPVPTDQLEATMDIEGLGDNQTQVTVLLRQVGKEDYYKIHGSDELLVIHDGITTTLVSSRLDEQPIYSAIHYADVPDKAFIVGFHRDIEENALHSESTLPAVMAAVWPAVDTLSRSGDSLEVTWIPAERIDDMRIEARGDCIDPWSVDVPDSGSFTVEPGMLAGEGTCEVTLILRRSRNGILDENFADGSIVAHRASRHKLSSTP